MKTASSQFIDQLEKSVLTLRRLWRLTPIGRDTMFYTDHDQQIVYGGDTYISERSFEASAIANQLGLGQANFEITALLANTGITKAEVEGGVYSGARMEVDAIFYDHPEFGVCPIFTGAITAASVPYKFQAIFSCNGFTSTGQHTLTETYSPTCRAEFCDSRCSLDIADFTTFACEVATVSGMHTFTSAEVEPDADYYNLGYVTWLTGVNAGRRSEVQRSSGGSIRLLIRPPFQIEVGDTFDIARGCDKTIFTCEGYSNLLNFRGEPFVPGSDFIRAPTTKAPPERAKVPPTTLLPGQWAING